MGCLFASEGEKYAASFGRGNFSQRRPRAALSKRIWGLRGALGIPGRQGEPGEDACACLEREIREELNLRIRCTEVLGSVVYAYPNRTIELTLVRAEIMQGEPELTEHTALRWLHGEEFQLEELCPADRELLLKCQEKLFSYKN